MKNLISFLDGVILLVDKWNTRHLDSAFKKELNKISMKILWTRLKHVEWLIVSLEDFTPE